MTGVHKAVHYSRLFIADKHYCGLCISKIRLYGPKLYEVYYRIAGQVPQQSEIDLFTADVLESEQV